MFLVSMRRLDKNMSVRWSNRPYVDPDWLLLRRMYEQAWQNRASSESTSRCLLCAGDSSSSENVLLTCALCFKTIHTNCMDSLLLPRATGSGAALQAQERIEVVEFPMLFPHTERERQTSTIFCSVCKHILDWD